MIFQISLGVDIRAHELCLVCLKASSRSVQLSGHATYPFKEGISEEEKHSAVSELIRNFIRESRVSPTSVFLGIPRNAAILRYLEFPIAVKENLRETLGYELEKHVPFSSEDAYFDFQIISEDKAAGRLKLLLVVVKKARFSPLLEIAAGLGVSGVEISSTALVDYFFWQDEKDNTLSKAFVYMGEEELELGLMKDRMLRYSRCLSRNENLVKVIPEALGRMRQDIGETGEPLDTVFCGAETDALLLEHLHGIEGINIRLADFSKAQIPLSNLIPAYGLALKGVWKTPININLLPPLFRKKPNKIKFFVMFALTSLTLLGALAWGGGAFFQHRWTLDQLDEKTKKLGSQLKTIERVESEKKRIEERVNYLNSLRLGGPPVLDVLKELSERIPEDAWVNRFDFSNKGLQIQGEATSASELILVLEDSPMFSDVTFLSAITKVRDGKERFRIGLSLK
jgi:Tfp pilus assembly protein PilN